MPSPNDVASVLKAAADYLAGKGIESPRVAAEHLMAKLLGCRPIELALRPKEPLSEKRLEAMRRGVRRVAAGEPVQYVIGETDFHGHTLKTDSRALIPRPETEVLVEAVLADTSLWANPRPAIVDVGTGSGCIAVALAKARPKALYLAFDVSESALSLARENAATLGLTEQITFCAGDLADALEPETLDAIIANLPYIASDTIPTLPREVRDHEPHMALDGGPSGLAIIETLIEDATILLKPGGTIALEIGSDQGSAVKRLLLKAGFRDARILPDLTGRDRIALAHLAG